MNNSLRIFVYSFLVQFDGEPAPQVTWMHGDINLETRADYMVSVKYT